MGGQETSGKRVKSEKRIGRTGVPLRRLMPRFEASRHGTYARTLYDACNPDLLKHDKKSDPVDGSAAADDAIDDAYAGLPRNVALLGGYGTGKSSIIQGFERYVRYEFRWLTKLGFPSLYTYNWFADWANKRSLVWSGRNSVWTKAKTILIDITSKAYCLIAMPIVFGARFTADSIVPGAVDAWYPFLLSMALIITSLLFALGVFFACVRRMKTVAIPGYIKVSSLLLCHQEDSSTKKTSIDEADLSRGSSFKKSEDEKSGGVKSEGAKPRDGLTPAADNRAIRYQADHVVVEVHPLEKDGGSAQEHSAKTLDIQREVVKQLIYSVAPRIVDLSHFHRLRSRRSLRENLSLVSVPALGCALLVFFVWISQSKPTLEGVRDFIKEPDRWWTSHWLFNAMVVVIIVCCLSFALRDRLRLSKVQAAAEGVSLSYEDNKANLGYFDKYLDEIIFLLEKANIRYVVFEDLDRADDMNIFYELRELNMLINSSTQMHNQTVTFIYVMGDDNFASAYGSEYETAESKAKFFDANVYVRPFFSDSTGGAVLLDVLSGGTDGLHRR